MIHFADVPTQVPMQLSTPYFLLRKLTVDDLEKDFDAVSSSREHLHGIFGPNDPWPDGVTREQDLVDLGWHQKEFELGRSFTYTVMAPDESRCLGCVYIYPSEKRGYQARVVLWVRASECDRGLDGILFEQVKTWLAQDWGFDSVAFPGREMSWHDWLALEDKQFC